MPRPERRGTPPRVELKQKGGLRQLITKLFDIPGGYTPREMSRGPVMPTFDVGDGKLCLAISESFAGVTTDPFNPTYTFRDYHDNGLIDMSPWDPIAVPGPGTTANYLPRGWIWWPVQLYVDTGANDTWSWEMAVRVDTGAAITFLDLAWYTQPANSGAFIENSSSVRTFLEAMPKPGAFRVSLNRNGGTDALDAGRFIWIGAPARDIPRGGG